MLLRRELVEPDDDSGFRFLARRERPFRFCWHHHDEWELTWIARGNGTRFVGDDVRQFESGDLVLLGSDLPHTWWSPETGDGEGDETSDDARTEAFCVQFSLESISSIIDQHPDGSKLEKLLEASRLGLEFSPDVAREVGSCLRRMEEAGGSGRFGLLPQNGQCSQC